VNRRALVPVIVMGAVLVVLAVSAIVDDDHRAASAMSLAALVFGFGFAVRQQRNEHEPDEVPSTLTLLTEVFEGRSIAAVALAGFVVVFVVLDETGPLAAVLTSAAVAANTYVSSSRIVKRPGIERDNFLKATSFGFGMTMTACGVWSMFEAFVGAPTLDVRAPWLVGMGAWAAASTYLDRQSA
jgi:hypothetical protein